MTLEAIKRRLVTIGLHARAGDHVRACQLEGQLHAEVLRAIADNHAGAREARAALRSFELQFPRYAA